MSTQKETVEFILDKLGDTDTFTARAMFGEYALYARGKVVALVCDDLLYVKILPASAALAAQCEQGSPYPGARAHYIVDESHVQSIENLSGILTDIAQSLPSKKKTVAKKTRP